MHPRHLTEMESPLQINIDLVSVCPESIATVLTALFPTSVMLLIAAANPTMLTTAAIFTLPEVIHTWEIPDRSAIFINTILEIRRPQKRKKIAKPS